MSRHYRHITFKTAEQVVLLREAAQLVSRTLGMIASEIKEGTPTGRLDLLAEAFIRDHGGIPAFKGYKMDDEGSEFPSTLCVSINEEVVHGIPGDRVIRDGDIVSVDCGLFLDGWVGDHAYTFMVGNVPENVQKLVNVTRQSLQVGINQVKAGGAIGDIGFEINKYVRRNAFYVVRELVGHGIGRNLHEDPQVPNIDKRHNGAKFKEGIVIAIEPMINLGTEKVRQLHDNWTIVTADGLPSCHFEHDVAFVNGKAEILSTFDFVEAALKNRDDVR